MNASLSNTFSCAFVTGASSGIGAALARLFASKGIPLVITGRNAARLEALAEELRVFVEVAAFTADLTKAEDRWQILQKVHAYRPDLVINNAGSGLYGEALTYETSEQLDIVNLDVIAVLELTLESARAMISSKKRGVILNVSSAAAMQVFPCFSVYAASKAFVNRLSESLDFEMRPYGVRVLASCPGMVATEFSTRAAGVKVPAVKAPVMTAEYAAEQIWKQIDKRETIKIFDWKTRCATLFSYFLPKRWVAAFLAKTIESRHPKRKLIAPQ